MSDFIYSSIAQPRGLLAGHIRSIYAEDAPDVHEFHGSWGSLAVSRTLYQGFQPLDAATHLCVVIGGPVLTFTGNGFLNGSDETAGSRLVLERLKNGGLRWDDDLSGPFSALVIDKTSGTMQIVTDLMDFIPVYCAELRNGLFAGTHIDALARAIGCATDVDAVSVADYVLNGAVTFPHTLYSPIRQLQPATVSRWAGAGLETTPYWRPTEERAFASLDEAAERLRTSLQNYVARVTEGMGRVACFLSGGEDTRAVLALLPRRCQRDALVFLDSFNREGRIAQACAAAFGAGFKPSMRRTSFYLDVFDAASRLAGATWEPRHAHTYEFHETADLIGYPAVFGGYLSDCLIKAHHVKKVKHRLAFLPQIRRPVLSPASAGLRRYFADDVIDAVRTRRQSHYDAIRNLRPDSAAEWLTLWPITMRSTLTSFHVARRLFRTYEPFMASEVVKISAATPQHWKLNRRLFHRMAKLLLEPVKWLPHSDGRLPYFSWANVLVHAAGWAARTIEVSRVKENPGPWTTFDDMMTTDAWAEKARALERQLPTCRETLGLAVGPSAARWPIKYKLRLLQILTALSERTAAAARPSRAPSLEGLQEAPRQPS